MFAGYLAHGCLWKARERSSGRLLELYMMVTGRKIWGMALEHTVFQLKTVATPNSTQVAGRITRNTCVLQLCLSMFIHLHCHNVSSILCLLLLGNIADMRFCLLQYWCLSVMFVHCAQMAEDIDNFFCIWQLQIVLKYGLHWWTNSFPNFASKWPTPADLSVNGKMWLLAMQCTDHRLRSRLNVRGETQSYECDVHLGLMW